MTTISVLRRLLFPCRGTARGPIRPARSSRPGAATVPARDPDNPTQSLRRRIALAAALSGRSDELRRSCDLRRIARATARPGALLSQMQQMDQTRTGRGGEHR